MRIRIVDLLAAAALCALPLVTMKAGAAEAGTDARIAELCPTKPQLGAPDDEQNAKYDKCRERARFTAYEPNYFIVRHAENDENAIRMHYSFRYLLTAPDCMGQYRYQNEAAQATLECLEGFDTRYEIYLVYTGEFDFYMGTRKSGPVVNRISNPGLHYRSHLPRETAWRVGTWRVDWWDIGIEHKSDGQTTDVEARITDPTSPNFGRYRTQVEYEAGNHAYFDSISRDTNFVSLETRFGTEQTFKMWTRVKLFYFKNETTINWGPRADDDVQMADYDILRLAASYRYSREGEIQGEWTVGRQGLQTDSFNLGLVVPIPFHTWTLPVYFRAHWGPLATLSNYTQNQKSFGVGLQFIF